MSASWCFNHRLELVFKPTMKSITALVNLEAWANKVYSFYGSSPKRTALLDEYMEQEGESRFRPHKGMTFQAYVMATVALISSLSYPISLTSELNWQSLCGVQVDYIGSYVLHAGCRGCVINSEATESVSLGSEVSESFESSHSHKLSLLSNFTHFRA